MVSGGEGRGRKDVGGGWGQARCRWGEGVLCKITDHPSFLPPAVGSSGRQLLARLECVYSSVGGSSALPRPYRST